MQLVFCKDIQISNIRQKRSYENEKSVISTKKLSVDNDDNSSKNDKHKHQETDEEMISSESLIVKKLKGLGGIAQYRIVFLLEENNCNPIKSAFVEEEWLKFETD
ncbi:hypothetical protein RCL_jg12838.t1 [Rhizophagus clarus]|uniref:Uncharacterized protein n=1 Tax=Rhizophagus clarus TaxID=94130 RepID=A0A8H3KYI6_9GLOM|nr:hypothetical protein RCL_jg12838.t1 [Rhizophagus clarus]